MCAAQPAGAREWVMLEVFEPLGIALGLGLLVGLQRQWRESEIAGLRTFALIALFGAIAGLLAGPFGGWIVAAGALALVALLVVGNLLKMRDDHIDAGMTTEMAAMVMYAVGAMLAADMTAAAIAVGGTVAVLLHWKDPLHRWVRDIDAGDLRAVMQLTLIALVILPLLPNQTYGPFDVLNPFRIWLMVVLIVGISLAGYVAYKIVGARAGTVLGGLLGGMISSTATTVSYARQSRGHNQVAAIAAIAILLASAVSYGRVLFEISIVAPALLRHAAFPLGTMLGLLVVLAAVVYWVARKGDASAEMPERRNPAQLKAAIIFGALYAAVIIAAAAGNHYFGQSGLYIVALISGVADMDAITLSTAEMFSAGQVEPAIAWRAILLASMANLIFKGGVVILLAGGRLARQISVHFTIALTAGALLLWLA